MLHIRTERFAATAAAVNLRPRMCRCRPAGRHGGTAAENTLTSGVFSASIIIVLQNAPIAVGRHVNNSDTSCRIDSAKVVRDVVELRLQLFRKSYLSLS